MDLDTRRILKKNSFVYDMNDSLCLLCVYLVCTLAVHVQCVCVCVCVSCVVSCVWMCACAHATVCTFGVSAHCAVGRVFWTCVILSPSIMEAGK